MKPKDHANLLSIFAWIMAGWQLLFVLLFGVYLLAVGGIAIAMALDPKVNDPGGPIVMGIMAAIIGAFTLLGLIGSASNFVLGKRLRSETPPTQKFVIVACVINFFGVLTGGIFAAALGGYALWFATSDQGKAFFAGFNEGPQPGALPGQGHSPFDPNYARDPSRINWR